ncbi:MAG: DoxX family protein [Sphingomonadales bacterium]|nr:DoxX family protein [Sphingomonadales bacterium]
MIGRRLLVALAGLPVAAFFGFVGWYKAFAPLAELQAHHAWTAHVPGWIGRPIGWSELAGAAGLVAGLFPAAWRWTRIAALWLAATQVPSSVIHWLHGETGELPKNLTLIAVLCLVACLARRPKPVPPAPFSLAKETPA